MIWKPALQQFFFLFKSYQSLLDKSTPHPVSRWIFTFLLITVFLARVFFSKVSSTKCNVLIMIHEIKSVFFFSILKGWYIVTYALGIYHLNLFIAFLSPKIDPAMSDFEGKYCLGINRQLFNS